MVQVGFKLRCAALAGVAGISLMLGSAACAQNVSPANGAQPGTAPSGPEEDKNRDGIRDTPETGDAGGSTEEIVVTGTLIRGITPTGANAFGVTREAAELSGATDTQQLLAALPQANNFMAFQQPGVGSATGLARVALNLPSLRNLGATFNAPTLVMMDGHRIVPAGIEQSAVDVGTVPTGIIERTEIILDGVSALYGSDAHGGVINFITRKRFDEFTVGARYGFADDYWSVDGDVTFGRSWGSGGLGLTYTFAKNTPLLIRDRPYLIARNYLRTGEPFTGTACEDHVTITTGSGATQQQFSADRTGVRRGVENCPSNGFQSFVAGQVRHGASVSFSQDITDKIKFDATGLYSFRESQVYFGPFTATQVVRSTNPYFRSLTAFGIPDSTPQTIALSYGPVLGTDSTRGTSTVELWQVTPRLSVDVGTWQVRALASYGESSVTTRTETLDLGLQTTMFAGTTQATTNNPYDIAASTNIAQLNALTFSSPRRGNHKFLQLRLTGDGPLFTLPGGEVRAAVGSEYMQTNFAQINSVIATREILAPVRTSTKPKSVFAELHVPIFGPDNRIPFFEALEVSGSARYDDYNEFGTTFNPKFAVNWEPFDLLTLRGNWGTSFRAPTAVNKTGGGSNRLTCSGATGAETGCMASSFFFILPPGGPAPTVPTVGLSLTGANEDLKPETSKNWAIGADIRPFRSLTIGATYYYINLANVIAGPAGGPTGNLDRIYLGAPQLVTLNPTPAQLAAAAALAPSNGAAILQTIAPFKVAYLVDSRTTNLGGNTVAGVDLKVSFIHAFDWGSIDATFNGSWRVKAESRTFASSPPVDNLAFGEDRFGSTATIGYRSGGFRGQLTWQHQSGFPVEAVATRLASQTKIPAMDLFNLAFRYNVKGSHPLVEGLQLTLTVNNIFDRKPPIALTTTGGSANGSTLGRFFQFGIRKTFGPGSD